METWKKIGKALLLPHMAIMLILLPVAAALLVYELAFAETETIRTYSSYGLGFYTLMVWCIRIPDCVKRFREIRDGNRYILRWREDVRLRMHVSLYGAFGWNAAYSAFQFCLGLYHKSVWFYAMAGYYILLAVMRFFLAGHTRKYKPGEKMGLELIKYCACGWIFLLMNAALTVMIFFMVYWNRTFHHHEITTIAMATYTFVAFTVAIVNIVKYRKYNSPVYSASKAISLAAACVSMLTLESTMLTTFGNGSMDLATRRLFLALSGGAVSAFIIAMAIYMIMKASRALKQEK